MVETYIYYTCYERMAAKRRERGRVDGRWADGQGEDGCWEGVTRGFADPLGEGWWSCCSLPVTAAALRAHGWRDATGVGVMVEMEAAGDDDERGCRERRELAGDDDGGRAGEVDEGRLDDEGEGLELCCVCWGRGAKRACGLRRLAVLHPLRDRCA